MMEEKAYRVHGLLAVLFTLSRRPGEVFDPSAWADKVEVLFIGARMRHLAVVQLTRENLNQLEADLDGAERILGALIRFIAGRLRGSPTMWRRRVAPALVRWLSAAKSRTTLKPSVVEVQMRGPPNLEIVCTDLCDVLRELHLLFGLAHERKNWVGNVMMDAFGVHPRNPRHMIVDENYARGLTREIDAAATLCRAIVKALHAAADDGASRARHDLTLDDLALTWCGLRHEGDPRRI
jgi:hypothetical protein